MTLTYSLNAVLFSSLFIRVKDSDGVVDVLKLKEPFSVNWPDAHGLVVDLLRPRFEARTINLDCWMVASSPTAFLSQLNTLTAELVKSGTQRLMITGAGTKPLVYEVYAPEGVKVTKQWRDTTMLGEFSLTLIEPQPAKWVLTGVGGQTASMTLTTDSPLTLYWGDGTKTEVMGTQTVSHTYGGSAGTTYYLIVGGELERLTVTSKTNLTELWPRLY